LIETNALHLGYSKLPLKGGFHPTQRTQRTQRNKRSGLNDRFYPSVMRTYVLFVPSSRTCRRSLRTLRALRWMETAL